MQASNFVLVCAKCRARILFVGARAQGGIDPARYNNISKSNFICGVSLQPTTSLTPLLSKFPSTVTLSDLTVHDVVHSMHIFRINVIFFHYLIYLNFIFEYLRKFY